MLFLDLIGKTEKDNKTHTPPRESVYVGTPNSDTIAELQIEWYGVTQHWVKDQLLGFMGYINALAYQVGKELGVIQKEPGFDPLRRNRYEVVKGAITQLVEKSRSGLLAVKSAIAGMEKQLKTWWVGGCSSPKTLRRYRAVLVQMGFFSCDGGVKGDRAVPVIASIDLERLLLFYEHLEEVYCSYGWELPLHRGKVTRLLYNAIFKGIFKYRYESLGDSATEGRWTGDRTHTPVFYEGGEAFDIYRCPVTLIPDEQGRIPEQINIATDHTNRS